MAEYGMRPNQQRMRLDSTCGSRKLLTHKRQRDDGNGIISPRISAVAPGLPIGDGEKGSCRAVRLMRLCCCMLLIRTVLPGERLMLRWIWTKPVGVIFVILCIGGVPIVVA